MNNGRKTVCEGLARARLGNTNDVASGQSHGPALGLNGCGAVEALCLDLAHNVWGETGLVEGCNGSGDVLALDGDLLLLAELSNFRF